MLSNEVYVIKLVSEDAFNNLIVGIATTEEKKDKMLAKLQEFDEVYGLGGVEYKTDIYMADCLMLNNEVFDF